MSAIEAFCDRWQVGELARIGRELADMCHRRVDLAHRPTIERSGNYIRRKEILESARVVYAA